MEVFLEMGISTFFIGTTMEWFSRFEFLFMRFHATRTDAYEKMNF